MWLRNTQETEGWRGGGERRGGGKSGVNWRKLSGRGGQRGIWEGDGASGRDGESGRGREAGWWEVYKKEREDDVEGVWSGPLSFQLMPFASMTANRQPLKGAQIHSLTKVLIRCGMAWKMLTCRQNVEVNWEADWWPYSNCQAEATCARKDFVISLSFFFPRVALVHFFFSSLLLDSSTFNLNRNSCRLPEHKRCPL